MVRSEDFRFGFTENTDKFMILGRNIEKIRNLCKVCRVGLNIQRAKIN